MNDRRIRNEKTLDSGLGRISSSLVSPLFVDPRVKHVYHMYAPKRTRRGGRKEKQLTGKS